MPFSFYYILSVNINYYRQSKRQRTLSEEFDKFGVKRKDTSLNCLPAEIVFTLLIDGCKTDNKRLTN
jgi:hypothetical protein